MDPKPLPKKDEEREKNLDAWGKAIRDAQTRQQLERMPGPAPEPERPTKEDPPVWERKEGTLEKKA